MIQAVALAFQLDQVGVVQEAVQDRRRTGTSPSSLPQSSRGRLLVMIVERVS
jgi:hypothetical protein